ncbi:hypothetical protein C8Q80DRAFT_1099970 [Daedaleopsis nitida]|nr:hypothetical protein C8Q80DRAFT_1099970 [Daedaleopsis nitida]
MIRSAGISLTAVTGRASTTHTLTYAAFTSASSNTPSSSRNLIPQILRSLPKNSKRRERTYTTVDDGTVDGGQQSKKLLKPHVLSSRLTKLWSEDKQDEAVDMLQKMPLDAQNVVVWNTIITLAGRSNRHQLAWSLFIEMKRRGFKPNSRTYATMLSCMSKVVDWSDRSKLLENAHKLYDGYLAYAETVKDHNPSSPERSLYPINSYLSVTSKARDWQRMFDVYNSLLDSDVLQPDAVTYTIMLSGLGTRSSLERGNGEAAQAVRERCASDARFIWRQLLKRIESDADIKIDSYLVDTMVHVLARGRPADHIAAFDILREYAGLAKPGETAPPATVTITPRLFSDALWLCNVSKKYRVCTHWVQQCMEHTPWLLDRGHLDHALTAYGSLGAMGSLTEAPRALQTLEWMLEQEATTDRGHHIRPGLSTYTLVLVACWRGKDWDSALRTFELMTGYRGEDFADGAPGEPAAPSRPKARAILPDAAAMSCLVRTALESGQPEDMRQCLRIVRRLGLRTYLDADGAADAEVQNRSATRFKQDAHYYAHKTASALMSLVDALGVVPQKGEDKQLTDEEREWVAMRAEAKTFLKAQRNQRPHETPLLEEQLLGSAEGLAATDQQVEWDMISREQNPSKHSRLYK